MNIQHKGWDWNQVESDTWLSISEEFLPVAVRWLDRCERILDLGAGKGRHAFFFAENGLEAYAIDLSESSIEIINQMATERKLKVEAQVADMTKLPYPDSFFDGIVCFHTIYHTDLKGMKAVLAEMRRVLKPEGEVYITFNSKESKGFKEEEAIDGYTIIKNEGAEKGIPHCYIDVKDIEELMSGYQCVSVSKIQNYVRKGRQSKGIHYFVHAKVLPSA